MAYMIYGGDSQPAYYFITRSDFEYQKIYLLISDDDLKTCDSFTKESFLRYDNGVQQISWL